ncbi:MAG: integrase arm-type DNA-binding domain-containing protein [Rudaea sp.]|uniref:tyrosine-type recombinase/integrase n=1 Tax=Rudaea sp. TaxID=2136325 RepID=UPI0039E6FC5C
MPKRVEPLSPSEVANAKPKEKPYVLRDGRGLLLLIEPRGGKLWRFDYRRPDSGKRNMLSLGGFPDVSLKRAREKRDEARRLLADGIDPGEKRKAEATATPDTFAAIGREWLAQTEAKRVESTNKTIRERMEADLLPWLGSRPINDIKAPELLAVLRRVEARGSLIVAKRLRQVAGQVFRYAVATGRAERDPSGDLRGALKSPGAERHHAALTSPADVGELLRAIDGYTGSPITRTALALSPLLFVRPGELRMAEWTELELDKAEWRIPASKMKMRTAHIVPLSSQAVAILRDLQPLTGGAITGKPDAPRYVFPGARSRLRPMSNNTVNASLRRIGYTGEQMTAHGFRATARTLLAELGWLPDAIERQLAHKASGPLGAAYDRAQFLAERRKMMQAWADYLDHLRTGAKVVPIKRKAKG